MAIDRNQTPIIIPTIRAGESFVIVLRPTGLKHNSPSVCRKYTPTSQKGDTRPAPVKVEANATSTNATPAKSNPKANFAGLDGCRSPIRCQMKAKSGANVMIKIGCTDWNQLDGNSKPSTDVRVSRSANNVRLDPACSNVIQNMIENKTRINITSTRLRSSPLSKRVVPPR